MVYVPTGNFFLGSGGTEQGEFEDGTSGVPFQVTSNGSLTLGGGAQPDQWKIMMQQGKAVERMISMSIRG